MNNNRSRLWDLGKTQVVGLMVDAEKVWRKLNEEMINEVEEEDYLSNIDSGEESWTETEEEEEEEDYAR